MQRQFRLTRSDDFESVRTLGRSFPHGLMVLQARMNQEKRTRFGVVAGRAVGNAVERNRAKRRLRALMRQLHPSMPPGWDIVLIARRRLLSSSYADVMEALRALLARAGIVLVS